MFASLVFAIAVMPFGGQDVEETSPKEEGLRVMTAHDSLRLTSVGSPRVSPDDQWILYTKSVRDFDDEQLGRTTHIWRVHIGGIERRQLTYGDKSCTSPSWHPDGDRMAFLSSRGSGDGNQVFFMYMDGGEAWQVTEHEGGVSSYAISPDGTKIAFTALEPESDETKKNKKLKNDPEVVDESFRMTHLWIVDLDSGKESKLVDGDKTVSDIQWSPDSSRLAYVARPNTKVDDSSVSDIWIVDLDKNDRKLYENDGPDGSPRWSPDGSLVAFASRPQVSTTTWYSNLYLLSPEGGEPRVLLQDFDLAFGTPIWAPDGESISFSTGQGTATKLFEVDLASGRVEASDAATSGVNFQFQPLNRSDGWVYSHSDPESPGDLWVWRDGAGLMKLTDSNPWVREEEVELGEVETIRWQNSEDQWIEGVLTKPVGWTAGQRVPLIVNPHGGPSSAVTESFRTTNHFFAGNGFMVFQPNFRGSSNYGQEFLNANRGQWGKRDYDDIMTGVEHLVQEGLADPERMVAYGWSYGGYMTFWMSTQTDRFKLISPGAGLSNLYSMYSTTDIPNYLEWFLGQPWHDEELYRELSPIRHVKNVTAKILIMHGANDARVPPEQAVEFYQALRDLGKDVTYVRYPRQGHGIRDPRLATDRLRRYLFAFCDVLGMTPVSDTPETKSDEIEGEGESVDVTTESEAASADLGIFEVIEER